MSARIPRMTASDSAETSKAAAKHTVFLDAFHEVLGAGRLKTASRTNQWADDVLVHSSKANQDIAWQTEQSSQQNHAIALASSKSHETIALPDEIPTAEPAHDLVSHLDEAG